MVLPMIFWVASVIGCIGGIVNECILDGGGLATSRLPAAIVAMTAIASFLSNGTCTGIYVMDCLFSSD
jgi:hypothetical protein